ncbi:MurR/RpiR family transcriptional regulator [Defluviimonas sp. SAOS-178_SWC]|uniref:MurR/RpiR family transcriptional regulator n=1 Tax=Defluviimonas sp. SAOS-178_SWC TaxID=3121287 RepID=UPI003221B0E8
MNSSTRSLEARIYGVYATLSPAERRLADVMLEHQMDLALYTAAELATEAKVSTATAARLIRTLGYSSYPSAKRQIREATHWGSPQGGAIDAPEIVPDRVSLSTVVQSTIDNIHATVDSIPAATLEAICQVTVSAKRVWIIGLRNGFGLAHYAAHYFGLVKDDVRVLPGTGTSMAHELAGVRAGDLVMVFAFRRRPKLLPRLLQELRGNGAVVTLITDISAAESAKAADHTIRCRCHSPAPFNSLSAATTVIDYIAWNVYSQQENASVAHFQRIDRFVELMDDVATPRRE